VDPVLEETAQQEGQTTCGGQQNEEEVSNDNKKNPSEWDCFSATCLLFLQKRLRVLGTGMRYDHEVLIITQPCTTIATIIIYLIDH